MEWKQDLLGVYVEPTIHSCPYVTTSRHVHTCCAGVDLGHDDWGRSRDTAHAGTKLNNAEHTGEAPKKRRLRESGERGKSLGK